jgi:hypothetical protein
MRTLGRHRARGWGRRTAAVVAAAGSVVGLTIALGPANALASTPGSVCEAEGVSLAGSIIAHANPPATPCVANNATILHPPTLGIPGLLGVNLGAIRSRTYINTPKNRTQFNASANVADLVINIGTLSITADVVRAQAQGSNNGRNTCYAGGKTYVGTIIVGGKSYVIDDTPTHIPLVLGLALDLNKESVGINGAVKEQGLVLTSTTLGVTTDVLVVAEAQVSGGCDTET